ncbi:MAG: hypothetical protein R3249_04675 [Nitriliruptorales bacterium]|nr:hypothetical protein [Nitriliruptorales bacterium]
MQFEELRYICLEAAVDLVRQHGRPVAPSIVLPGPDRTRVVRLEGFPDTDEERHVYLERFAASEITEAGVPCWGFVSEATTEQAEVLMVAFGARLHRPHVTASAFDDNGLPEEFIPSEEVDRDALPFLHPLQLAVDALAAIQRDADATPGVGEDVLGITET